MTHRIRIALCMAFVLASRVSAQPPAEEPAPQPRSVTPQPETAAPQPETVLVSAHVETAPDHTWSEPGPCCEPSQTWWLTSDGMVGWVQRTPLPPLITTSPAGTAAANAGVLGQPGTTVLFGGSNVNEDIRIGFRLGAGYWFDCEHTYGIEAGFSMLESQATGYATSSSGNPILARPYTDATSGLPQAVLVAFPGSSNGSVEVTANSGNFYEAHFDLVGNLVNEDWFRLDSLVGYRFYRYGDGLRMAQSVLANNKNFAPGTEIVSVDDFSAGNEFHGGDFGLRADMGWEDLSLDLLSKLAVGSNHRDVLINGLQTITAPGAAPVVNLGGVYALTSNIGHHTSDDWTILPEFGVTLGWQLNCHWRLQVGYSLLILQQVVRAADQVNLNINPALFPPATIPGSGNQPQYDLDRTNIWLQTLNFGIEFSF